VSPGFSRRCVDWTAPIWSQNTTGIPWPRPQVRQRRHVVVARARPPPCSAMSGVGPTFRSPTILYHVVHGFPALGVSNATSPSVVGSADMINK
jgi:hypothetical protein